MGRAYAEELSLLGATYAHALAADIAPLRESIDGLRAKPIIIVGSGGSVSACHLTARLHETAARLSARVMTPLEFIQHPVPHDAGILLLSASGGNPDILAAAAHAIAAEYAPVVGLCTRPGTQLRAQLAAHRHTVVHEYTGPSAKDGFLATNSLLLTATLLARAYRHEPPPVLPCLAVAAGEGPVHAAGGGPAVDPAVLAALERRSLIVLASAWSTAAAYDVESKWGESGFATVTVTDARNFAHGRHYGLSQRLDETAVLGLAAADDLGLTERTMDRLPPAACRVTLRSPLAGAAGALDLLAHVIQLAGAVGSARGVDPGRPRVPAFGRTLYHDGIPRRALAASHPARGVVSSTRTDAPADAATPTSAREDLWIRRKVTPVVWESAAAEVRQHWRDRCRAWVGAAESARIGGVVLDYDGTLCEADERFTVPAAPVGEALTRLVDQGLVVGVATGRGNSVLEALRAILPDRLWSRVIVGMYNGGVIGNLADSPVVPDVPAPAIRAAHAALEASPLLTAVASVKVQPTQLTVRARQPLPDGVLQRFVLEALGGSPLAVMGPGASPWPGGRADVEPTDGSTAHDGVQVFASSHTVDVIVGGASKLRVVAAVRDAIRAAGRVHDSAATAGAANGPTPAGYPADAAGHRPSLAPAVMTIGDQGHHGGNDWPFLAQPLGLSVERVSSVFDGCWNVAPVGARRTAALHAYLSALAPDGQGTFRWTAALAIASASTTGAAAGVPRMTRPRRRAAEIHETQEARDTPGVVPVGERPLARRGR